MLNFFREQKAEPEKALQARLEKEGWQLLTVERYALSWVPEFFRRGPIGPSGPDVSKVWYEKQFGAGNVRAEQAYDGTGRPLPINKCAAIYIKCYLATSNSNKTSEVGKTQQNSRS